MTMVKMTINNREVEVPEGTTILKAARRAGIEIPTLCYLEEINEIGACRVCVVEVEGANNLQPACVAPVAEGMKVRTDSNRVRQARKLIVELILSDHPYDCLTCERNLNCELQELAEELGINTNRFSGESKSWEIDGSSPAIVRNSDKCILCRRCQAVCGEVQKVKVLEPIERGFNTLIAPAFNMPLADSSCAQCGQCSLICPVGAIYEQSMIADVWEALDDPEKHVVVQSAPAVRATLGEEFGYEPGTLVTGQMAAALRRLGFDRVFDTNFTADLTIMEEGSEFIDRLENGGELPLITSCSPGWIKFCEHYYPELLDNLSSCKSPQQMFGALAKTYYAEKEGLNPEDIYVVSIMPCTAKKFEISRPEMQDSGYKDVDAVLTTRELGRMLREVGVDFGSLEEEEFDPPLGISTGAAAIFGATGGVMEAALRSVYEIVTEKELPAVEFYEVRGMEGIKEAAVDVDGIEVRVAVAHGLGNARKLFDTVISGEREYHFIEIMCCPGGCIGGGGQPIPTDDQIREKRIAAIYEEDSRLELRKSHENPAVKELYEEFLGEPLGEKSHKLLHTEYKKRDRF